MAETFLNQEDLLNALMSRKRPSDSSGKPPSKVQKTDFHNDQNFLHQQSLPREYIQNVPVQHHPYFYSSPQQFFPVMNNIRSLEYENTELSFRVKILEEKNKNLEDENIEFRLRMKILEEKNEKYKKIINQTEKETDPENINFIIKKFFSDINFIQKYSKTELKILIGSMINKINFYTDTDIHDNIDEKKTAGMKRRLELLERELSYRQ